MNLPRLSALFAAACLLAIGAGSAGAAPASIQLDFGAPVAETVTDKDGEGTGFDFVVPNAGGTEYDASRIDLQAANGLLELTATQGSNGSADSLKNQLVSHVDTTASGVIGARLLGPLTPLATSPQQGGIILGPDQDNYVKLVASASGSGPKIQFYREIDGAGAQISSIGLTQQEWDAIETLDLYIRTDPGTGSVTAQYSVNGQPRLDVTNGAGAASYTIPSASRSLFFQADARAGIIGLTNFAPDVAVSFDWFRAGECVATGGNPGVATVAPVDGATEVARNTPVTAEVSLPNCGGIDPTSLTSDTAKIVDTVTGQPVPATTNTTGGGDAIIVQPSVLLEPNRTYEFQVSAGLEDLSGAPFAPHASSFTTGEDLGSGGTGTFEGSFSKQATSAPLLEGGAGYTSLAKGPDGKLYAVTNFGSIFRFPINGDGTLGAAEQITTISESEGGPRVIIGLAFDPASTPSDPILWVTHNDTSFASAPDWSGKITRLTGGDLQNAEDVIVGLPRSAHDHMSNSLAFDAAGHLFLIQGSNSAMGAPDNGWAQRPERQLTAAVLELDPSALPAQLPLDVTTAGGGGTYDPFAPGAPLTVYASGVRNAYDLLFHSNGHLYVPGNGSAAGGSTPSSPVPLPDACESRIDDAVNGDYTGPSVIGDSGISAQHDYLYRVEDGGYYGHPNPTRCEWVMGGGNPTAGVDPEEVTNYPEGTQPDRNYRGVAFDFGPHYSPNGVVEYSSPSFGGALQGTMMIVRWSAGDDIILITPNAGDGEVATYQTGVPGLSGFENPLDIAEDTDTGNLYVIEYPDPSTSTNPSRILLLTPGVPPGGDTTAPEVADRAPADGATGVAVDADVTVDFSEALDPASVTGATVQIAPQGGSALASTRTLAASDTQVVLDPDADLDPDTQYTVTLTGGVTDAAGNPLDGAPVTWSFTTAPATGGEGAYRFDGAQVVIEAENADASTDRDGHSWDPASPPAGAVGGALTLSPDSGDAWGDIASVPGAAPELGFEVEFPAAGTYRLALRGLAPDTGGNSVHVGLDGQLTTTSDAITTGAFGSWQWLTWSSGGPNPATITVPSAGVHTVNVWGREDGFVLDRLVIAEQGEATPTGEGPAESSRS
jgi:glucose/arabinose dehydrogenase/methionine-rich copper-binding protein CopC